MCAGPPPREALRSGKVLVIAKAREIVGSSPAPTAATPKVPAGIAARPPDGRVRRVIGRYGV
ncbi:hypothetical protein SHIRM173S_02756 [Streptomyces hirsutus]